MASKYYQLWHSLLLAVALSLGAQGWWGFGGEERGWACRHIWVQLDQGVRSVWGGLGGGKKDHKSPCFQLPFSGVRFSSPPLGFSQGPSGPCLLEKSQTHTSTHTYAHTPLLPPPHIFPHIRPSLFGQGSGVPEKLSQMCWSKGKTKQTVPLSLSLTHV